MSLIPARSGPEVRSAVMGDQIDGRVLAAAIDLEVELQTVALVEPCHAGTLDRADVHERIGLAIVAGDEAEALHRVEELDRSGRTLAGQFAARSLAARTAIATIAAARTFGHGDQFTIDLEVAGRNLAAAIDQREFQALALGEVGKTGTLDCADVNEDVFTAAFLLDEAEALLAVEELDCTLARANDLGGHAVEAAATAKKKSI